MTSEDFQQSKFLWRVRKNIIITVIVLVPAVLCGNLLMGCGNASVTRAGNVQSSVPNDLRAVNSNPLNGEQHKMMTNSAISTMSQDNSTVSQRFQRGVPGRLGAFTIGVMAVFGETATLSVASNDATAHTAGNERYYYRTEVRAGDLLPIGDQLYKVAELLDLSAGGDMPGNAQRFVVINTQPVELPGIALHAGSVALIPGAQTLINNYDIEMLSLEADGKAAPVAHFDVWPNEYVKEDVKKELIKNSSVKVGETLTVGDKFYRIVSITAPDEDKGLRRGWVEIALATNR